MRRPSQRPQTYDPWAAKAEFANPLDGFPRPGIRTNPALRIAIRDWSAEGSGSDHPLGACADLPSQFPRCAPPHRRGVIAHEDIVMTGGVMSWHDLALYLIERYVGAVAAQAMARMLMLEWHGAG